MADKSVFELSWTAALHQNRTLLLILASISFYVFLCRALRFRRLHKKIARFPYKSRDDYARMTAEDAFHIVEDLGTFEFPYFYARSLDFALFKTYGIPTISKLLAKTDQLGSELTSSKRIADTTVLISEFSSHHPESDRHNSAISRMNYIHSLYQKAGHISNEDMLYTLALFVLEPIRWIHLYEWRDLMELEVCGMATFWKSIGDAMNISYAPLSSGPSSFCDGLQWFEELAVWTEEYERKTMLPDKNNHYVAKQTTEYLLDSVPESMKPMGRHVVSALMTDRLRIAMMYPEPPSLYPRVLNAILALRKFVMGYLTPPRPNFLKMAPNSAEADPNTGRYYLEVPMDKPWYKKPTPWRRFGPSSWASRLTGKPYPGSDSQYRPDGYHLHEIGPHMVAGRGMKEFEETRKRLMAQGRGGCPFAFGKKGA